MSFGNFYPKEVTPKRLTTYDRRFDKVIHEATLMYLKIREARDNGLEEDKIKKKLFVKGNIIVGETIKDLTK